MEEERCNCPASELTPWTAPSPISGLYLAECKKHSVVRFVRARSDDERQALLRAIFNQKDGD